MLIDLSHLGLIEVSGQGAKNLLQGQLTCNMDDVTPTQSRLGAHCNPQGRMLSLFRIFMFNDNYYLQMPQEILSEAILALQKYAVFFKAQVSDASKSLVRISGRNPGLTNLPEKCDDVLQTENKIIIKLPGENYEIVGDTNSLKDFAATAVKDENLWKCLNIENKIPSLYLQTVGKLLPHEVNLQNINGISFTKGCYTGQEIIARMQYRGQLKKQMFHVKVKTNYLPSPGDDIYLEKPCGIIVDSCNFTESEYHLLVIADKNTAETEQLFLDPEKTFPLEFTPLS